ncbi:hypothetical protein [Mucilaginibacter aquariorum]|uniref:Uncharacterized protein n=1 Tax=Mucilaginibacter aquariorum TaxID=2967225 RepID=A0ABT1SZB3_9SPHI|nr:hypothetical protein [Mucilaginibacter aquariorum]MCQ6957607.1 hypothetical protein [Mucilaginibacter aquariorum]
MPQQKLPKHWFPLAQLIVGVIFAYSITRYGDTFYAYVTIYVSVMFSIIIFWLENREIDVISESQMLAHLKKKEYLTLDNIIGATKIKELLTIHEELDRSKFILNPSQLDDYTTKAIEDILERGIGKMGYYATHIVNDAYYVGIWGSSAPEEEDQRPFVEPQKKLLNRDGEVIRIFIIVSTYFNANREKVLQMLDHHDKYYDGTAKKITTLIYKPSRGELLGNDISIVSDNIVFEWIRDNSSRGYRNGNCYIMPVDTIQHIERFKTMKERAITKEQFLASLR